MKPEDFLKSFDTLIDAFVAWIRCLITPARQIELLLSDSKSDVEAIRRAGTLWMTSFILTVFLQSWVYRLYGISLKELDFYFSSAFFLMVFLLLIVLSMHVAFGIARLPQSFRDTFVTYTVYEAAYYPFAGVLLCPYLLQMLAALKALKAQSVPPAAPISAFFELLDSQRDSAFAMFSSIVQLIVGVLQIWLLARVLSSLSERWGADRARLFNAGASGTVVACIALLPLAFIQWIGIYSFLAGPGAANS